MESEITGTRWAIPRPSLTCSVSSNESSNRTSRSSKAPSKSRSSASSQGSSSNHSTHSASSGSLLLSAANLNKMNAMLNNQPHTATTTATARQIEVDATPPGHYRNNLTAYVHSTATTPAADKSPPGAVPDEPGSGPHGDPFWRNVKSDVKSRRDDAESVASSTHFTVVNGFTRHDRGAKGGAGGGGSWCCKSSHQITVLVVTMTILFTAGILAAICYVEMRQRRDIGSRFS